MLYLTIVCVLVTAVAAVAVLVSSILQTRSWQQLNTRCNTLDVELKATQMKLNRASETSLRVELDALAGAVDKHARSVRKQFGSIWARIQEQELDLDEPEQPGNVATDAGSTLGSQNVTVLAPQCSCGWCQACQQRKLRSVS